MVVLFMSSPILMTFFKGIVRSKKTKIDFSYDQQSLYFQGKVRNLDSNDYLHSKVGTFFLNCTKCLHRRKKRQIPAAFWPLFKNTAFEFRKYESFAAFIMPK